MAKRKKPVRKTSARKKPTAKEFYKLFLQEAERQEKKGTRKPRLSKAEKETLALFENEFQRTDTGSMHYKFKYDPNTKTEVIEFRFEGVEKLSDKIDMLKKYAPRVLDLQLEEDRKPPRGLIVVADGKKGTEENAIDVNRAVVSQIDMPINTETSTDFATDFLEAVNEDVNERIDFYPDIEDSMSPEDYQEIQNEGYGDFDPDSINTVYFKFFY
jgi:hypothetical protein